MGKDLLGGSAQTVGPWLIVGHLPARGSRGRALREGSSPQREGHEAALVPFGRAASRLPLPAAGVEASLGDSDPAPVPASGPQRLVRDACLGKFKGEQSELRWLAHTTPPAPGGERG